jgi:CheY-like chemotaxis protein
MNDDSKHKRLPGDGRASTPEKRADDIMRSVLGLNQAELTDVYRSQTEDDPTQKLYDLAAMAATGYQGRGEPLPSHVQAMLNSSRQQHLKLEGLVLECVIPKILLVDSEGERLVSRRNVFESHQYRVEIAFTLAEALEKLSAENYQAVVVEWSPISPGELDALQELQTWNLQIPVMNVSAWARLARQDDRRFNWNIVRALAKVFGRSMPRKLPERKPVAADAKPANREDDLFGLAGS